MGMDVMGKYPTNEKGEYFRNNVWWWRPLADYILENYSEIANGCQNWHSNDGDGLDDEASKELSKALVKDLMNGTVLVYEQEYNRQLSKLERKKCLICDGSGIRSDKLGIEHDYPNRELEPEVAILTGRSHGTCNGCSGVGTQEAWGMSYPFSAQNVAEFAEFLENCGGFEIC